MTDIDTVSNMVRNSIVDCGREETRKGREAGGSDK